MPRATAGAQGHPNRNESALREHRPKNCATRPSSRSTPARRSETPKRSSPMRKSPRAPAARRLRERARVTVADGGLAQNIERDHKAGKYAVVCFIRYREDGKPHVDPRHDRRAHHRVETLLVRELAVLPPLRRLPGDLGSPGRLALSAVVDSESHTPVPLRRQRAAKPSLSTARRATGVPYAASSLRRTCQRMPTSANRVAGGC